MLELKNYKKIYGNKVMIFNKIWVAIKFLQNKTVFIKFQEMIQMLKA